MSNHVYQAIAAVAAEMASTGISKDKRASAGAGGSYNFRGIDDVYNNLAPLLAKHKLCILPRCISRSVVERAKANDKVVFYVTVHAEFDLVSAEDGSKHTISTFGEAMDSGDKATNKAMSAAYKYAAFQAFCIPTEETAVDADSDTHDVVSRITESELNYLLNAIHSAPDEYALSGLYRDSKPRASDEQLASITAACRARKEIITAQQKATA